MQEVKQLGKVHWTNDEIRASIPEFLAVYQNRPFSQNDGGMKSPHMFATWFMLKKLNPKSVVESGIWRGQGTWLIEQAVPNAQIISLDVNLSYREYISKNVTYIEKDFFDVDWSIIEDKNDTVLFFDDHQNAFDRVKKGKEMGFKQFIFEDNYPIKRGDCYSLKKAFQHGGFSPVMPKLNLRQKFKQLIKPVRLKNIPPNAIDAAFLQSALEIYFEFPPVIKKSATRWHDSWDEEYYPTPEPLYDRADSDTLKIFDDEATSYTWICYGKLK